MATNQTKPVHPDDVATELAALRADIMKLSHTIADLVKNEAARGAASVKGAVHDATERVHDAFDAAREHGKEFSDLASAEARRRYREFEHAVERSPLTAIGIAALVGYLAGLTRRGSR